MALHPAVQDVPANEEQLRVLHKTIAAVTHDTETLGFNTAIARMMEFVNYFTKEAVRPKSAMESFVLLLSPYAPHLGGRIVATARTRRHIGLPALADLRRVAAT